MSGDTGIFGSQVVLWTMEDGLRSITPRQTADTSGGISSLGRVVLGGFPGNGTRHAFRWTEETGAVSIGDLPGGEFRSDAGSISVRGNIIVGVSSSENSDWEAFRWTEETGMVGLGDLPGGQFISTSQAISANGLVIVGSGRSTQGPEAYRWTAETGMVGLGALSDEYFQSIATTVSADGSVVVGISQSQGQRAFRWTEETGMVRLSGSFEQERWSRAHGTSWDGNVIVGQVAIEQGPFGAFYWTPEGGMRWLADALTEHGIEDHQDWQHISVAYAVSADGRTIVGAGINPDGDGEGWVAYLGPACRADFDDDGSVSAEDVAAYLTAWLESNIFADWNYDGSINTRDLIGFFNEWVAKPGCE
ncbi:MAG: GC-type dockerin domain-anchored protein [Planctomycetota bacterium]|nr:GC-type dockerin domain-anchored protein [Planctomycetota bacterium]